MNENIFNACHTNTFDKEEEEKIKADSILTGLALLIERKRKREKKTRIKSHIN